MERYSVDIDPLQVVRWVKAESEIAPSALRLTATRRSEVREIPARSETHFGDEEREDLTEVATLATLDIAPAHTGDGWLLSVVVEDEIGPRTAGETVAAADEQPIDFGTFYNQFIRPQRGIANVVAQLESPAAEARLADILRNIEENRHVAAAPPAEH
jgi:hypothetical protein